jgi:transcriptional regulator with XRE-family HTH domain
MRTKKDEIIWQNVERLLTVSGMTKADLARKTGMTPQAINSLKINGIGSKSIVKLANAFGVAEEELISNKTLSNAHSPPDKKEDMLLQLLITNIEDCKKLLNKLNDKIENHLVEFIELERRFNSLPAAKKTYPPKSNHG